MRRFTTIAVAVLLATGISAVAAKKKATKAKAPTYTIESASALADSALCIYDLQRAETMLGHFKDALARDKSATSDDRDLYDEMQDRLLLTRNMLDRVEQITVIDTLLVDSAAFFQHYILSPQAGTLASDAKAAQPNVTYTTEQGTLRLWSEPNEDGYFTLRQTTVLGDGRAEAPVELQGDLNGGGDANYPFLMPDGVTLYYANNGQGSLGGYDIFMTRRGDDGQWLQPQNIGMPFNSPFDDYLLAIDEVTGIGWWATNRHAPEGKVTIYVYKPNALRVNYNPDSENITALALLEDLTGVPGWGDEAERARQRAMLADLRQSLAQSAGSAPAFMFAIPDRGVYTQIADFKSPRAAEAMQQYLDQVEYQQKADAHLELLRQQFARGNRDVATEIMQLEKKQRQAADEMLRLKNQIIQLETK